MKGVGRVLAALFPLVAMMMIGGAGKAAAQCYSCINSTGPNGPTCDAYRPGPYQSCGCPCQCSGACPDTTGGGEEPEKPITGDPEELAALGAQLPSNGILVSPVSEAELVRRLEPATILGRPADNVFLTSHIGLVRYGDGAWRAFPLETADSFVIRDCQGRFVARARSASTAAAQVRPASVVLAAM